MKIRIALHELGLSYEDSPVDLRQRENRQPAYRAIHPRGQVPALEDEGAVLWESGAILAWLIEKTGKLMPKEPRARARAWSLLFHESAAFQPLAGEYFFDRAVAPKLGLKHDPEGVEKASKKIGRELDILETVLLEGPYLAGDFSAADIAYSVWFPTLDLGERPRLSAWFDRVKTRPSWTEQNWAY